MAEWLGNGLQNRAQQFDSAWDLQKPKAPTRGSELKFFQRSSMPAARRAVTCSGGQMLTWTSPIWAFWRRSMQRRL